MHELFEDPRVLEAKKLLRAALSDATSKITQIKTADNSDKVEYEAYLQALAHARSHPTYFPYIGSGLGHGPLVQLLDGSVKLDFIGGIGVYYLGHSNLDTLDSQIDSALTNTVMQGNLQQNIDPLLVSEKLIECSGMDHCFLTNSGAMATENALKLAFQYKRTATRILAFESCFMGRSMVLSQITDKAANRIGLPTTLDVDYIPFYKDEASTDLALQTLKKYLHRYPNLYGGMCFELIQGEGGLNCGNSKFFKAIMQLLKENEIPIIADEIQTFGRTSNLFAYDTFNLRDYIDIVCIGKMSQVCATLFKDRVKPSGTLLGQTFTSSTSAYKACLHLLDGFQKKDYLKKNGEVFEKCKAQIERLKNKYPNAIEGPYGMGAMLGFTVEGGNVEKTTRFAKELFNEGLITFTAGTAPMKIRMLPPTPVLREGDIELAFSIVERVLSRGC